MRHQIPILMYHRVPRDAAQRAEMAVPLADFTAQMNYLAHNGIAVLSLLDFARLSGMHKSPPGRAVVITFDDGYAATCDHVEEVLARHGFTATLFLATGLVGVRDPLGGSGEGELTWARVRALSQMRVQAHTVSHMRLPGLRREHIAAELSGGKTVIEHEIGMPVTQFAYPFGAYTDTVTKEVRAAGYTLACAVHRGPATTRDDLFHLHRVTIDGRDSLAVFARKAATGYGSVRDHATSVLRDGLYALPGLHDAVERWRARAMAASHPERLRSANHDGTT